MKTLGLSLMIMMFPFAVWLLSSKNTLSQNSAQQAIAPTELKSLKIENIDLQMAADRTMRKIAEIDDKILEKKAELMKQESERQKVMADLAKIHSKISELLKKPANF